MSPTAAGQADSSVPRSPLQRLLDVGVYAPIGLLANKDEVVTDLADQGRKQLAFSRSLGRAVLRAVRAGARTAASDHAPAPARASATDDDATETAATTATAATAEIADYGSLSARDIIALIPSCSPQQRQWIESTELAGKARVTVLRALQSD